MFSNFFDTVEMYRFLQYQYTDLDKSDTCVSHMALMNLTSTRQPQLEAEPVFCNIITHVMRIFHDLSSVIYFSGTDIIKQENATKAVPLICMLSLLILGVVIKMKWKTKEKRSSGNLSPSSICDLAKTAYKPGHADIIIHLVNKDNIDINCPLSKYGLSLFMCACLSGERKLIQFLLKKGANIHQRTPDGDTVLYLATFGALTKKATLQDRHKIIEDLIYAGCDINCQNNKGYTPLHRAASRGDTKIIKCLLRNGANPYLTTTTGIYPVDLATNAGHMKAAEMLCTDLEEPSTSYMIPCTPSRVRLGLLRPSKKHLVESTVPRHNLMRHIMATVNRSR